jgi:hypothetical protein
MTMDKKALWVVFRPKDSVSIKKMRKDHFRQGFMAELVFG